MKFVFSQDNLLHNPPREFIGGDFAPFRESPERVERVRQRLLQRGHEEIAATDHGFDAIHAVHDADFVAHLEKASREHVANGGDGKAGLFPDSFVTRQLSRFCPAPPSGPVESRNNYYSFDLTAVITEDTWKSVYSSAQTAITAASVFAGSNASAFALTRPPGHHAHSDICGGYCYLNNAAIVAKLLRDRHQKRVAILDIDYHHGNGTQDIFYQDANPLYISLHGDHDFPWFTGKRDERGDGEGLGFNINIPLPKDTDDDSYLSVLNAVFPEIEKFKPDVLVVSLGVDTHQDDPVGGFRGVTTQGFARIGHAIGLLNVPCLFLMEGGYAMASIGENVVNVIEGFESSFQRISR